MDRHDQLRWEFDLHNYNYKYNYIYEVQLIQSSPQAHTLLLNVTLERLQEDSLQSGQITGSNNRTTVTDTIHRLNVRIICENT